MPESSALTAADVRAALSEVLCPGTKRDIVAVDLVGGITVDGESVTVEILHTTEKPELIREVQELAAERVGSLPGVAAVEIVIRRTESEGAGAQKRPAESLDPWADRQPIPHVKHIVAVASAKGGVGKSSVAVNLALALHEQKHRVGLLDADVYGPSVPTMLAVTDLPEVTSDRKLRPVMAHGIQVMSIGFWLDPTQPVVWRGPMVFSQIKQFLRDVLWPDLDYLVVDLPPGTGDAQLTLIQQVPLAGVIMVTTPQEIALTDVRRGIQMFRGMKVPIPVLGVVENMSRFVCPDTGKSYFIFGRGGGASVAQQFGVPLLAEIPIDATIREGADEGRPAMANPDSPARTAFLDLAAKIVRAVA